MGQHQKQIAGRVSDALARIATPGDQPQGKFLHGEPGRVAGAIAIQDRHLPRQRIPSAEPSKYSRASVAYISGSLRAAPTFASHAPHENVDCQSELLTKLSAEGVHNGPHAGLERMPKVSKETFNLARYLSRLRRSVEGQDDGLCPVEGRG